MMFNAFVAANVHFVVHVTKPSGSAQSSLQIAIMQDLFHHFFFDGAADR
jgi:hypothetical protein